MQHLVLKVDRRLLTIPSDSSADHAALCLLVPQSKGPSPLTLLLTIPSHSSPHHPLSLLFSPSSLTPLPLSVKYVPSSSGKVLTYADVC